MEKEICAECGEKFKRVYQAGKCLDCLQIDYDCGCTAEYFPDASKRGLGHWALTSMCSEHDPTITEEGA